MERYFAVHCREMAKAVGMFFQKCVNKQHNDGLFCALCFGHSGCIREMIMRKNDTKY